MAALAKEYGVKKAVVQNEEEAKRIEEFFEYILVFGRDSSLNQGGQEIFKRKNQIHNQRYKQHQ